MTIGPLRFTNALGGTADWIYPGPTIDMQSPASAGAVDGTIYLIYAQSFDMAQWEIATGAYTASSGTFARTTVLANSLGTTAKINFGTPPQVFVVSEAGTINLTGGQIKFPATQDPSSDPNTLDDYEEGFWTPGLTLATPGDLSVVLSNSFDAYYTKIGQLVTVNFALVATTFTYTTASGNLLITGLPFLPSPSDNKQRAYAPVLFQGFNKAGYSAILAAVIGNSSSMQVLASGMGQPIAVIGASDVPSAASIVLAGSLSYNAAT